MDNGWPGQYLAEKQYPKNFWQMVADHLLNNAPFLRRLHYALGLDFLGVVTAVQTTPTLAVKVRPIANAGGASTSFLPIFAQGYTSPTVGDVVLCSALAGGTKWMVVGKRQ